MSEGIADPLFPAFSSILFSSLLSALLSPTLGPHLILDPWLRLE